MKPLMEKGPIARGIVAGCVFALLGVLAVCGCTDKEDAGGISSGRAPDFSLQDIGGKKVRLKDLRGKVVLINFFATWCAPCRQEVPDFIHLYKQFKDKGFEIVGIGVDMEGEAVIRPFAEHLQIPYPVVAGTREVVMDYGGITGVPTSFFVDREGYLAEQFIGLRPAQSLEKTIVKLLAKKAQP